MIYVMEYRDTDDGEMHNFYPLPDAKTVEEGAEIYERSLLEEINEYAFEFQGRLKFLESREFTTIRTQLLDVKNILKFNTDAFIVNGAERIHKAMKCESEAKEKAEYERLKKKYGN